MALIFPTPKSVITIITNKKGGLNTSQFMKKTNPLFPP